MAHKKLEDSSANSITPEQISDDPATFTPEDFANRMLSVQQRQVYMSPAVRRVVAHGRRWGGSTLSAALVKTIVCNGGIVDIMCPSYQIVHNEHRTIRRLVPEANPSNLRVLSAQDYYNAKGYVPSIDLVIVLCAGMFLYSNERLKRIDLHPQTPLVVIGTPDQNDHDYWFKEKFLNAERHSSHECWTFSTAENSAIPQDVVNDYYRQLPEKILASQFYGRFPQLDRDKYYNLESEVD